MPPRFYVPEARDEENIIELHRDEAVHLTRVLRLRAGDAIRIFNGHGDEWDASVDEASKHRVFVRVGARVAAQLEPRSHITLAMAVLKGDKMDGVVRDAVMLGVASIQPIVTERTEPSPALLGGGNRAARWQRIAVASAKQCGRAVVPAVHPARRFSDVVQGSGEGIMLVEPNAAHETVRLTDTPLRLSTTLLVGPEGGWSEEEVSRAQQSGAMLVTLGTQTLRADAVPLIALTALRVHLEDF